MFHVEVGSWREGEEEGREMPLVEVGGVSWQQVEGN